MNKLGNVFKAFAVLALAVVAGLGTVDKAHAFSMNIGDLAFALYGNDTEYLLNLGQSSSVLDGGTHTFTINPSGTTGANTVYFSMVGFDVPDAHPNGTTIAASVNPASSVSGAQPQFLFNSAATWGLTTSFTGNTISAANSQSFTSTFGSDGLAGSWPVSTRGLFGSTLYLVGGDVETGALTTLATAFLSQDGTVLTIAGVGVPNVPIPAAVILFGTGLAGLVGVARRKMITT